MLDDIVYDINSNIDYVIEFNRGNIGTVSDILTESNTNSGILLYELEQTVGSVEYAFAF